MKSFLLPFTAFALGALITVSVGKHYVGQFVVSQIQRMEQEQRYRCMLSVAVLERLETNEPDRAKLILTREVATYYKHPVALAESAQRKELLAHIEALRVKSSTLDKALKEAQ